MEQIKARNYRARVSDKYYLTENQRFLYVILELVEPNEINFEAGQYVSLKVDEKGTRRSYSIVSSPDDKHGLNLLAEILPNGKGSEYLQKVQIGEEIEVLGPLGKFIVNEKNDQSNRATTKRLFVATGSGIVPIWSMINDLLINKNDKRPMRLHWGMRSEADLFWLDELEQLAEAHPYFIFDVVLSQPSEKWELCRGHVQDCLSRDFDPKRGSGLAGWEAYVCGKQEVVVEISDKLVELGMKKEDINHEKFN